MCAVLWSRYKYTQHFDVHPFSFLYTYYVNIFFKNIPYSIHTTSNASLLTIINILCHKYKNIEHNFYTAFL